jgi:hypothetical protein
MIPTYEKQSKKDSARIKASKFRIEKLGKSQKRAWYLSVDFYEMRKSHADI